MITKNYKSIFSYVTALAIGLLMVNCEQEDNTGFSTLDPTSPSLNITTSVSDVTIVEGDQVYEFTASISEVQLVDVKLYAFQTGGNATLGDDFSLTQSMVIPAGSTSAKGSITILQDELKEPTETAKIQIGNNKTANAAQASATMNFTILNYTEGDLKIALSWEMSETTTDNSGKAIDPEDFADMRLLISSTPDNSGDIGEADDAGFESFVIDSDTPNGVYYVVADFYDADSEIFRDLNLDLVFNEIGLINDDARNYASAINNTLVCEANFYVMAMITKSGDTYTIEDVRLNNMDSFIKIYSVGYDVLDYYEPVDGYASHIATGIDCTGAAVITGLNQEWMEGTWGEDIEEVGTVYYTVDDAGVVTIEEQYIFTTSYKGTLYPYTVTATGTLDEVTGELYLEYHLFQDGWSVDGYWFDAGGLTTPYFEAKVSLE